MEFKVDPEIAGLFEDLDAWTYEELKKDIRANGIRNPIIVAEDGTIVCGHQRYKLALELGIEPPYKVQHFESKREMMEYAIKDNLLRRHLNTYQKGLIALKLLEFEKKEAQLRRGTRTDLMDETSVKSFTEVMGRADEKAAKRVGISHVTLRKVQYIEENGPEELKAKTRSGEVSLEAAFKELRSWELKGKPKPFPLPKLKQSKLLYPVKIGEDYYIATTIPSDWCRGVKVTIEPLEEESLIAKAKRELDEAQTKNVLKEMEREDAEADRLWREWALKLEEEQPKESEQSELKQLLREFPELKEEQPKPPEDKPKEEQSKPPSNKERSLTDFNKDVDKLE